jgi:hypothetical protein
LIKIIAFSNLKYDDTELVTHFPQILHNVSMKNTADTAASSSPAGVHIVLVPDATPAAGVNVTLSRATHRRFFSDALRAWARKHIDELTEGGWRGFATRHLTYFRMHLAYFIT